MMPERFDCDSEVILESSGFEKPSIKILTSSSCSLDELSEKSNDNPMEHNHIDEDDPLVFVSSEDRDRNVVENNTCIKMRGEKPSTKKFDYQAFNDKRVMSPSQERWNAITMLPAMFYGIYFVLTGCWLTSESVEIARQNNGAQDFENVNILGHWMAWAKIFLRNNQEFHYDADSDANTG
jgi:hypothetical protein